MASRVLRRSIALVGALLGNFAAVGPAHAQAATPSERPISDRERVLQASVIVVPKACAGSVVASHVHVLTAAHCIPAGADRVDVKLRSGRTLGSRVEYLNVDRDLALLHLDEAVAFEPLELVDRLPLPGDDLFFLGRFDRNRRGQHAGVVKLGRCPSLPNIDDAVFTSINAKPGDSGAPIVDNQLRVVAIIHGGAACHIAAPVYALTRELARHPDGEIDAGPSAPGAASPSVGDAGDDAVGGSAAGPFVFEKTPTGFRFKFSFHFETGGSKKP
ncbi:MAG TPA: serine protease [Polyangiaceae bacterium]|jgi:S1-C subfamily serine protease|nr:serine protease [Polyangiaceae bacterium]